MIDDQLAASLEEVGDRLRAIQTIKAVWLLDLDPGELAPLATSLITQPGQFLFFCEQFLASNEDLLRAKRWRGPRHLKSPDRSGL